MSRLTDERIDFIVNQINNSQIDSEELKEDLVDHFCCVIEDYLRQGKSFKESYNTAYQIVCPNGFNEIYRESIFLLTSKRIKIMKKLLFITGFIVAFIQTTGILFKILHWPKGGLLLLIAFAILIFVLLPLVFLHYYKKEYSKFISYKLKYILGYLGLALLLTGGVLKLLHWPGSGIALLFSLVVLNFGYLPLLLYRSYKGSGVNKYSENHSPRMQYIFGLLGIGFFLAGGVFKILHLPGAAVFLGVAILIINFGFLPFFFYGMYKKSTA
jgi:hypothetical protein